MSVFAPATASVLPLFGRERDRAPLVLTSRQPWLRHPTGPIRIDWSRSISKGLVASWSPTRFDAARGVAYTRVGGTAVPQRDGMAVAFAGSGTSKLGHDELTIGYFPLPMTVACRVKWSSLASDAYQSAVSYQWAGLNNGWRIGPSEGGTSLYATLGGVASYTSGVGLIAGAWYHVVWVITGSNMATPVYVNGAQVAAPTIGTIGGDHPDILTINGNYYQDGDATILDVNVWSRALSAAEVWSLYDPRTRWDLYR